MLPYWPHCREGCVSGFVTLSVGRINLQPQGNRVLSIFIPSPDVESPIDELSAVCQDLSGIPLNRSITVTNEISNSPTTWKRACHQVSPPYPSAALRPPSSPCRSASSTLIDRRSEDSLTAENDARCSIGENLTERRQRMSPLPHISQ